HASIQDAFKVIGSSVSQGVNMVVTDESSIYPIALGALKLRDRHYTIRHRDRRYVDGVVHTNTIESAFSLLKRGIIGNFHKVSIKHLQRYLNEFQYRFNRRQNADAFIETVRRLCKFEPLTFAALTCDQASGVLPEPF